MHSTSNLQKIRNLQLVANTQIHVEIGEIAQHICIFFIDVLYKVDKISNAYHLLNLMTFDILGLGRKSVVKFLLVPQYPDTQINTRYSGMCKVYTEYHGTSETDRAWSVKLYLSLVSCSFPLFLP